MLCCGDTFHKNEWLLHEVKDQVKCKLHLAKIAFIF